jgi:hypothetical protein
MNPFKKLTEPRKPHTRFALMRNEFRSFPDRAPSLIVSLFGLRRAAFDKMFQTALCN